MYDIKPIEEEWEKYKKKKNRPLYYIFIGFIIVALFLGFLVGNVKKDTNILFKYFYTLFSTVNESKESFNTISTIINGPLNSLELSSAIPVNFLKDDIPTTLVDIPILNITESESEDDAHITRKKMHLDIIETSSITAYKDVEKRFYQSHDIDDALFLAKSYYKKNNYSKSEYWALQTNKLDASLEESFFIFVKSKIKLGRKNEAVNILMTYIKKSNSDKAKNLLYRINNNKF